MNHSPPRWARWLLIRLHPDDTLEEVEGDLDELYMYWYQQTGKTRATLRYLLNVVSVLPPFVQRRQQKLDEYQSLSNLHPAMLRNYLKIAFRNLGQNKAYTAINLFGLTLGTACCLYMLLYVRSQYGYDQQQQSAHQLYRVTTEVTEPGGSPFQLAPSSPPIAKALQDDFGEVAAVTRLFKSPSEKPSVLKVGPNAYYETKGYYVDSSFFQLFTYRFLEGAPQHALDQPHTVVLSNQTARKVFGQKPALNQSMMIGNDLYQVTGVYDETYQKSHIRPHFLMSFRAGGMIDFVRASNQWVGMNLVHTYIRLQPNTNPNQLAAKLPAFLQRHGGEQLAKGSLKKALHLQPVTDIHLTSQLDSELEKNASPTFIRLMLLIAGLIQLMACINFMNLNTARSTGRAREVGVRKVLGASRISLVGRFMGESMLLVTLSVLLAIPVVWLSLPLLNDLLRAELPVTLANLGEVVLILVALVLITGLLAGSYPAFYLTAYQAVNVLKGNLRHRYTSVSLRQGLVVTQFVISITLLIAIIVITRQLQSFATQDIGFDQRQKLVIPFLTTEAQAQRAVFADKIRTNPLIKQTGSASYYPSHWAGENMPMFYQPAGTKEKIGAGVWLNRIDETFLSTLHIPLLRGRNLTLADTSRQILVNETALQKLTIPLQQAIGTTLFLEYQGQREDYTIVGVVNDFNFRSLKETLVPLMLQRAKPDKLNYLIVDVQSDSYTGLLDELAAHWRRLIPGVPFTYSFLDADLQQQYEAENALLGIVNGSALIAFLIACLGLFGLATFTAEQRTKEIGVRKVLGASVGSILGLLAKDFLKLVLIAFLIASPLAWWAMNRWLQNYAYKIAIDWWLFALAGSLAVSIALLTISFQSIKVALANPVKSLRSE